MADSKTKDVPVVTVPEGAQLSPSQVADQGWLQGGHTAEQIVDAKVEAAGGKGPVQVNSTEHTYAGQTGGVYKPAVVPAEQIPGIAEPVVDKK